LKKGNPAIANCIARIKAHQNPGFDGIVLMLDPEVIKQKHFDIFYEIVGAFQHDPELLKSFLMNVQISCTNVDDSELSEKELRKRMTSPEFQNWMHELYARLPQIIFFLQDKALRFYCMTGVYTDKDAQNPKNKKKGILNVYFSDKRDEEIDAALCNASVLFMDYCIVAGIDPEPIFDKVMKEMEYEEEFDYEDLLELYDEKIESEGGINYTLPKTKSEIEAEKKEEKIRKIIPPEASPFSFKRVDMFKKDRFLIPKDSPLINDFKDAFVQCDGTKDIWLALAVPPQFIKEKTVSELVKVYLVAQHFPLAVKALASHLRVYEMSPVKDKPFEILEKEFLANPDSKAFLEFISEFVKGYFFLYFNLEYRLYSIIGNLEEENAMAGITGDTEGILKHKFTHHQVEWMMKKARLNCKFFMEYCSTANVDSKPLLEKMITDMNFDFTYNDVEEDYQNMVKAGYHINEFTYTQTDNE